MRLTNKCAHFTKNALFRFRNLLHVIAFAAGRFISVDMVDTNAI